MKRVIAGAFALIGLMTLDGCAVVPFAPAIAHIAPRVLFPGHQPAASRNPGVPFDDPAGPTDPAPAATQNTAAADSESKPAQGSDAPAQPADGTIPLHLANTDFTSDSKAHDVGDILLVNVAEAVSGQTSAQTDLSNKRSVDTGLPNMFTAVESLGQHNPLLNLASLLNGSSENDTSGKGDMAATNTINATVAVSVVKTLPGGKLKVTGERSIRINGEHDTLRLSGLVDPGDIDSDNSIPSSRVADLHISFTGSGLIRDKQGGGWGTRLVDWLWLF
jgi:flagellar L-ring protein precursor FlgH